MIQISLSLTLFKGKTYKDGTHPIMLRYNYSGKTKGKVISRCLPDQWDEKARRLKSKSPNATVINHYITEQVLEAEALLYEIKSGSKTVNDIFKSTDAFTLAMALDAEYLRLKDDMKVGTCIKIEGFKKYLASIYDIDNLELSHMDLAWFQKFSKHLKDKGNIGSTALKTIKTLRAMVYRYCGKHVDPALKNYRISTTKSLKAKLTPDELQRLRDLQLPDDGILTASRDIFLMQVYLRGIRIGDLLQARSEDFGNGNFNYTADKTGKTAAMKLIPRAVQILEKYKSRHERLFPVFTWKPNKKLSAFDNEVERIRHKQACTTLVNTNLRILAGMAGITKPLSSHIARHTFARMAIDKINNPMVTMELLGHSSLAVHQQYLNDIRKEDELDQAADDIFG